MTLARRFNAGKDGKKIRVAARRLKPRLNRRYATRKSASTISLPALKRRAKLNVPRRGTDKGRRAL
jgi:hypothetical protein